MVKLRYPCAHCGRWILTPSHLAGRQGRCPACQAPTRVPRKSLERIRLDVRGRSVRGIEVAVAADLAAGVRQLALDPFLRWLQDYAQLAELRDGQTLAFGWQTLRCRIQDGRLILLALDLDSEPLAHTRDLTHAVYDLLQHTQVAKSFGEEPEIPLLSQSVIVSRRFDELPCLMVRRDPTDPRDSGWTVNSLRSDVDTHDRRNLEQISLFAAQRRSPRLFRYLSLPVGYQIAFDPARSLAPMHFRHRRRVEPQPWSYLAQIQLLEVETVLARSA